MQSPLVLLVIGVWLLSLAAVAILTLRRSLPARGAAPASAPPGPAGGGGGNLTTAFADLQPDLPATLMVKIPDDWDSFDVDLLYLDSAKALVMVEDAAFTVDKSIQVIRLRRGS